MRTFTALSAAALYTLALSGVSATWRSQPIFQIPSNIVNVCTEKQTEGYNFSDLIEGDIKEYDNFSFSGWKCGQSKLGKRTGGDAGKYINTIAQRGTFSNSISCKQPSFSLGELTVSADEDNTDFEFHYTMPSGSTCKQTARCGKGSSTVKNTQCGGAKSVKVKIPEKSKKEKCGIKFHEIKFECGNTVKPPGGGLEKPCECKQGEKDCRLPDYCKPKEPTCDECKKDGKNAGCEKVLKEEGCRTPICEECKKDGKKSGCDKVLMEDGCKIPTCDECKKNEKKAGCDKVLLADGCKAPSCEECKKDGKKAGCDKVLIEDECRTPTCDECKKDGKKDGCEQILKDSKCGAYTCDDCRTTPMKVGCEEILKKCIISSSGTVFSTASTSSLSSSAASSTPISSSVIVTPPSTTSTISSTAPTTSSSIIPLTSSSIVSSIPSSSSSPPSTTLFSSSPIPSTIITTPDCPDTLPSCLKTWLFRTTCLDNADTSCFCPLPDFVELVYDCLKSHSPDTPSLTKASEYFLALCQPHIPNNPKIVDCIPDNVVVPPPPKSIPVQTVTRVVNNEVTVTIGSVITVTATQETKTLQVPAVTFVVTSEEVKLVYPPATVVPQVPVTTGTGVVDGPSTLVAVPSASKTAGAVPSSSLPPQNQIGNAAGFLRPGMMLASVMAIVVAML